MPGPLFILHPGFEFDVEMEQELPAIEAWFPAHSGSTFESVPRGATVLPRFRALPFGRDLEAEVGARGATLLNSYGQHRFAADLGQWYPILEDLTPRSRPISDPGAFSLTPPFVVKGETNSRRGLWKTHCYAVDRTSLGSVVANLTADSLISHQMIWVREFVPLNHYFDDVAGMPVSEEYRFFFLDGKPVASGFYWGVHLDDIHDQGFEVPDPREVPQSLLEDVGSRIEPYIRFAAVDFARTAEGGWVVIEVNDGSMSGCCGVNPWDLYAGLANGLDADAPFR